MRWERTGGADHCQECLSEAQASKQWAEMTKPHPLPCARHGDPRVQSVANQEALAIYRFLPCETVTIHDKPRAVRRLDLVTIDIFMTRLEIDDLWPLLARLQAIDATLNPELYRNEQQKRNSSAGN